MDTTLIAVLPGGLDVQGLSVHAGARELVRELSIRFAPGEVVAILGRNGSGKTLSLHTLAGLRAPAAGAVLSGGTPLAQLSRRALALRVGLLPQDLEDAFVTTVLETVLIGRHPHLALWQWESAEDERVARESLAQVDMSEFAPAAHRHALRRGAAARGGRGAARAAGADLPAR